MPEDLARLIRDLPEAAFGEPEGPLRALSYLDRIRWLEQTALFVWRFKGAARASASTSCPTPELDQNLSR